MCERVDGVAGAIETPVGYMPTKADLDLTGLDIADEKMEILLSVDKDEWKAELPEVREFLATMGDKLPGRMTAQVDKLEERLNA